MSDDYRLLITGSRKATQAMLNYAVQAVQRAKENGWQIIVGDAEGVDAKVVESCNLRRVTCWQYGVTPLPRNGIIPTYGNYYQLNVPMDSKRFLRRDEYIARHCQRVLAIWNGSSKGTLYTYSQARNRRIPGDLINFGKKESE